MGFLVILVRRKDMGKEKRCTLCTVRRYLGMVL